MSLLNGGGNGGFYNTKNLGFYSYTYHNPIRLIDPDGNNPALEDAQTHNVTKQYEMNIGAKEPLRYSISGNNDKQHAQINSYIQRMTKDADASKILKGIAEGDRALVLNPGDRNETRSNRSLFGLGGQLHTKITLDLETPVRFAGQNSKGMMVDVTEKDLFYVFAHEMFHGWQHVDGKGAPKPGGIEKWSGIDSGVDSRLVAPSEVYATRYTNNVRKNQGLDYVRSTYRNEGGYQLGAPMGPIVDKYKR